MILKLDVFGVLMFEEYHKMSCMVKLSLILPLPLPGDWESGVRCKPLNTKPKEPLSSTRQQVLVPVVCPGV